MRRSRILFAIASALIAAATAAAATAATTRAAHQTLVSNGVAVTLHVIPNDEPIAEQEAVVWIVKIATRNGVFKWSTCRCHMTIFKPDGTKLLDQAAVPKINFTFPEVGAYGVTVSGRVYRKKKWANFKVTFGLRADQAP
jgi:hypothetical protein